MSLGPAGDSRFDSIEEDVRHREIEHFGNLRAQRALEHRLMAASAFVEVVHVAVHKSSVRAIAVRLPLQSARRARRKPLRVEARTERGVEKGMR